MIYLASPYTHSDATVMEARYQSALGVVAKAFRAGRHIYSPIVHCHPVALQYLLPTDFEFWQNYNRDMIRRCSYLYVLDIEGWKQSVGVQAEIEFAKLANIPVFMTDVHFNIGVLDGDNNSNTQTGLFDNLNTV